VLKRDVKLQLSNLVNVEYVGNRQQDAVLLWRSSDPPGYMSVLLTDSRIKAGVGLTWESGSACLQEAGRR